MVSALLSDASSVVKLSDVVESKELVSSVGSQRVLLSVSNDGFIVDVDGGVVKSSARERKDGDNVYEGLLLDILDGLKFVRPLCSHGHLVIECSRESVVKNLSNPGELNKIYPSLYAKIFSVLEDCDALVKYVSCDGSAKSRASKFFSSNFIDVGAEEYLSVSDILSLASDD